VHGTFNNIITTTTIITVRPHCSQCRALY